MPSRFADNVGHIGSMCRHGIGKRHGKYIRSTGSRVVLCMKHVIQIATTLVTTLFAMGAAPRALAGDIPRDIVFDVYRNGSEFGRHAVRFGRDEVGDLVVDVDIALRAGIGPITVFRYRHEAEEVWSDGQLQQLTASTLKDGERTAVDIRREDGVLSGVEADGFAGLAPSSHWRGYDVAADTILNTETGQAMDVEIADLGWSRVETASGPVRARHLRMAGTLTVDLWYDETGRWVGCAFEARGQSIRYVLRDT